MIESYTPKFIVRNGRHFNSCRCKSCERQSALVTRAWSNQVRHSAQLACDTVSRSMLFDTDALDLIGERVAAPDSTPLDAWQNNVNQGCIALLLVENLSIEERLHAIGILLSRTAKHDGLGNGECVLNDPLAFAGELISLSRDGILQQRFREIPAIDKYKLIHLRRLSRITLDADLDSMTSISLTLRQAELQLMSSGYLVDVLRELESNATAQAFFEKHESLWTNYFLYRCFHEVFPGAEPQGYAIAFLDFTTDYFCIRNLCALLSSIGADLTEATVAALFSAWYRTGRSAMSKDDHVEPLLIGMSLISSANNHVFIE
ncbi:hypothetical protein [Burkholderia ubonensis]|uniref:hypothetical protein n=1 Tax=Burkholderia ubonensis TaxID=101571 RepID=UPI00075D811C|nr:hypothetical protein [Burkholderia ubonensis]KWB79380.1 tRNA-ribosyltransferase [Burkholderia ubonensis]